MGNYIGLVDCNNFFVSCERLFRPDLIGKPVVVLSSNDGCVVARSNEVKELGVPMGVPHFQVKDVFKKAGVVTFSSNFTLYRDISARVMRVLQDEMGVVEQYSVDEAFFAIIGDTVAELEDQIKRLKSIIEQRVGVPVSIGVAPSKTIAKYASNKEKRASGYCVLEGDSWRAEQRSIPLATIWGIGQQLNKKFQSHGLHTVADLVAADDARIAKLFGVVGTRLQAELQGVSVFKIGALHGPQQSIMSTRSFSPATSSLSILEDQLAGHVRSVAEDLRAMGAVARRLQVVARPSRYGDWALTKGSREVLLEPPTSDTTVLLKAAMEALGALFDPAVPYKKTGVVASGLQSSVVTQASLFAKTEASESSIWKDIDGINKQFGKGTITAGTREIKRQVGTKYEYLSPRYTTKWSEIRLIKA